MHIRFNNKTALVTGAGSGIGAAIAQGLASAGLRRRSGNTRLTAGDR